MSIINDEPLSEVVNFVLDQTVRQARNYAQRRMDELHLGITVEQWVLLKIIHQEREMTQVALSQIALKDTASITRMLDLLVKKGYVLRVEVPTDRRKYLTRLTEEGKAFVNQHMELVRQMREQTILGLTEEEVHQLKSMLLTIRNNCR